MFRTTAATVMLIVGFAIPALAAEPGAPPLSSAAVAAPGTAATGLASVDPGTLAGDTDWKLAATRVGTARPQRGAVLPTLYVSLAALNAYDVLSTRAGLAHGALEANGAMQTIAASGTALVATKAAVTAGTIVLSEHLWKTHHKGGAIAMMVISNGLMSAVAIHNNAVLHDIGR